MTVDFVIPAFDSPQSISSICYAVRNWAGGDVALDCCQHLTGKMCAELVVGVTVEPGAQIFVRHTVGQILAQQPFNGFGDKRRGASIAHSARDGSVLSDRSAEAKVVSVGKFALVLDLLAFDANVGNPVLAAAV